MNVEIRRGFHLRLIVAYLPLSNAANGCWWITLRLISCGTLVEKSKGLQQDDRGKVGRYLTEGLDRRGAESTCHLSLTSLTLPDLDCSWRQSTRVDQTDSAHPESLLLLLLQCQVLPTLPYLPKCLSYLQTVQKG